jgi:diguanylate cyclase (GGDEF)-like protein
MNWIAVVFVTLIESLLCIAGYYEASGSRSVLFTYAIIPGAAYALIGGAVSLISWKLLTRRRFISQAYTFLTGVSLLCAVFTWTHYNSDGAYTLFAVGILLSLYYYDFTLLRFAISFNVVICTITFVVLGYFTFIRDLISNSLVDSLFTGVSAICAASLLTYLLLRRQNGLLINMLDHHESIPLDPLTQFSNHSAFYEQLDNNIMQCHNSGQGFCLIMLDIDDFQCINTVRGHKAGDAAILTLVQAINEVVCETEEVFRYGGDELAILTRLSGNDSLLCAETIRTTFSLLTRNSSLCPSATVSAGVCAFDPSMFNGRREFFAAADEALFEAKRRGKNVSVLWSKAAG